jgi:hypothetical protein
MLDISAIIPAVASPEMTELLFAHFQHFTLLTDIVFRMDRDIFFIIVGTVWGVAFSKIWVWIGRKIGALPKDK